MPELTFVKIVGNESREAGRAFMGRGVNDFFPDFFKNFR